MVRRIREVDYILCGSELEALLLESRLIKEHLPEYNITQRKLRNYPFIKITMGDDFPRIFVVWEIEPDKAKYLGPFPRWYDAEETVELIHKLFPVRKCSDGNFPKAKRPCLNYHIGKCLGPCNGNVTKAEYRKLINTVILLLNGQRDNLIRDMEQDMKKASARLEFERAAKIRDRINGIREAIYKKQFRVNSVDNNNLVAIYPSNESGSVELFFIKKGVLSAQKRLYLNMNGDNKLSTFIAADIEKIFFSPSASRRNTMSKFEVDAMNIISRWLYRHRDDQALVYIKRKANKSATIAWATKEIQKVAKTLSDQTH
jgi:excinuclease ABC subunit C